MYRCKHCKKDFKKPYLVKRHEVIHVLPLSLFACVKTFLNLKKTATILMLNYASKYNNKWKLKYFENFFNIKIIYSPSEYDSKSLCMPIKRNRKTGKFELYNNLFPCIKCDQVMEYKKNLRDHKCNGEFKTKQIFNGGGYLANLNKDLWIRLSAEGFSIPEYLRKPEYFIVFDFETRFVNINKSSKQTKLTKKLIPLSFAICSNIPKDVPFFYVNEDVEDIIYNFVNRLIKLSNKAYKLLKPRYEYILNTLENRIQENTDFRKKDLLRLKLQLINYIKKIPTLGFNSSKFDVPLIKNQLCKYMVNKKDFFMICKGNNIHTISTSKFVMLDVCNFISPGFSLEKFLITYLGKSTKEIFPYEYIDSYDKLYETTFPSINCFYSSLKKRNVTQDQYDRAKSIWDSLENKTLMEYLKFYNLSDVVPFMKAISNLSHFWWKLGKLNTFRDGLSLPGLAYKLAFSYMNPHTAILIPNNKYKNIVNKIIDNSIIGGPSIIFTRYSCVNETKINENLVKSIISYDLNSLYSYCFTKVPNPLWDYIIYQPNDDGIFIGAPMNKNYKQEMEWLGYEQMEGEKICNNHRIIHQFNGGPVKMLSYLPVDGYCASCYLILQYNGCYWHGGCSKCEKDLFNRHPEKHLYFNECKIRSKHVKEKLLSIPGMCYKEITSCEWKEKKKEPAVANLCKKYYSKREVQSKYTTNELLNDIKIEKFFGLVTVDIHIPDEQIEYYDFFPPFFHHAKLELHMLSDEMQKIGKDVKRMRKGERVLISSLEANNITLITPLLKYYIDLGFKVTKIHNAISYFPGFAFEKLGDDLNRLRAEAQKDESKKSLSDSLKLVSNSIYGKFCERKDKHEEITFANDHKIIKKLIKNKRFQNLNQLGNDMYQISLKKRQIVMDTPRILAGFILGNAKLKLLKFVYTIKKYAKKDSFGIIGIDTDNVILELSHPSGLIDDIIKDELRDEWNQIRHEFLPKNETHIEQKKPGIFKIEYKGKAVVALSSKCYILWNNEDSKVSAKGVQKKLNILSPNDYKSVLFTKKGYNVENCGFKKSKDGTILQYEQYKLGLTPFYAKRIVLDDLIHTTTIRWK